MKKFLVLVTVLLLVTVNSVFAETPVKTYRQIDRATAEKAFEQLAKNAQKGLLTPNAVVQSKFVAIDDVLLPLYPNTSSGNNTGSGNGASADNGSAVGGANHQPANQPIDVPVQTGIKVWFEGTDGKLINPSVYRFSPKEEFFVHIESAVPVFVTLYQHFPHKEGKEPILAYPVPKFPSSYRLLNPAERTKLFTKFETDGNDEAEYMSIVVARADWSEIPEYIPDAASLAVASAKADTPEKREAITQDWGRSVVNFFKPAVLTKFAGISKQVDWDFTVDEKIVVVVKPEEEIGSSQLANNDGISRYTPVVFRNYRTPPPQWDGTSDNVNDVANYLFTDVNFGQLQIVLNKVEQFAP